MTGRRNNIPWGVFWQEAESRDGTTQVTESNVHSNTNTSLQRASDVVTVPCDTHGDQWVDTGGGKESTGVLNCWLSRGCKHSETDDSGELENSHENTSLLGSVGKVSSANGEATCYNVRWNGHKLGFLGSITHVLHNSNMALSMISCAWCKEEQHTLARRERWSREECKCQW